MTPSHSSTPPVDNTRELLQLIADDTRRLLPRWINLSFLLACPAVYPPDEAREAIALADKARTSLRTILGCAEEAIQAFDIHNYDDCLRMMEQIDRAEADYIEIDRNTREVMLGFIFEGGKR